MTIEKKMYVFVNFRAIFCTQFFASLPYLFTCIHSSRSTEVKKHTLEDRISVIEKGVAEIVRLQRKTAETTLENNYILKEIFQKIKTEKVCDVVAPAPVPGMRLRPTPARTVEELELIVQHPDIVSNSSRMHSFLEQQLLNCK